MKKVLITGASGFVGQGILAELIQSGKYDIYVTTTNKMKLAMYDGIHIIETDLTDYMECDKIISTIKPQYMIHLAWSLQGNDVFQNCDSNMVWLEASLRLLRCFVANQGERFLFAGSSSEYDFSTTRLSESSTAESMNLYGKCKKAFTETALAFCREINTSFVTARYFSVYGENDIREARAIPTAIKSFINKQPVVCKSPNAVWDYIYIEDAAKATIMIMESSYEGIVNVSTAMPISMKEVFRTIAQTMNCESLLSFENLDMSGQILVSDNHVLKDVIGFVPKVDFNEGISKTIDWWKKLIENRNNENE